MLELKEMASLEVELQRKGSLHAPKQKLDVDRPWSNGLRAALRSPSKKTPAHATPSPSEADGTAAEEEKKLLGRRGQKLKQAGKINCITNIPEAKVVAAGREDGKLLLWKVWKPEGCNRDVTVLSGHNGRVASIIHMPPSVRGSGSYLLFTGSSDLTIKVWDPSLRVPEKVCIQTLSGHGGTVTCMALAGRSSLVSGSTDGSIRLWRAGAKEQGSAHPVYSLLRTIAVMDDWVNAMSFDTTKRVGDLGILYTADSAGGLTAFLPQVADGLWRPDGTTPLDFAPAGPATSYGLLGSAKSVRLFGMGASSRGTSAASARDLSTRSSSRATDRASVPPTPPLSPSPEPSNLSSSRVPLERISEGQSMASEPVSPDRKVRVPTRFSPDVEAQSSVREEARERSGSRASTSNREEECERRLSRSLTFDTGKGDAKSPAPPAPATSPKSAFLRLEKAGVSHVLYDAAHHLVITLARDQRARAYNEQSGTMLLAYENPQQVLFTGVAWDPAHQEIILVDDAGYLYVYSQQLPGVSCCQQISSDSCTGVLFLEDADTIAAVCGDHVVFLQLERERDFHTLKDGHSGPVVAFCYLEKGKAPPGEEDSDWLFSAGADGTIKQWDMDSMVCKNTLRAGKTEPSCLYFCDEEKRLISGHDDGSISLWNLDTRQAVTLREQSNTVTAMASFTRQNGDNCLVTASFDGTIVLWNIHCALQPPAHVLDKLTAHEASEILCVAYHPEQELLFTAGNDMRIKAWSMARFECHGEMLGHEAPVPCLLLRGKSLFSGSENGSIRLWDVSLDYSTAYQRTLIGHKASVTALVIQESTGHLLSSSLDSKVCLWDYDQGLLLKTIAYEDELRCLAARRTNDEIIVGTQQGSMVLCRTGTWEAISASQGDSSPGHDEHDVMDELEARLAQEA